VAATCRRAGIKDLHFHDLGREYTSRLREAPGISDHEIRDLFGHANISTTSRYLATARTGLQRAVRPFEAHRVRTSFAQNGDKEAPPCTNEQPAITANLLHLQGEEVWLGGRDSNPDNVVQSAVHGRACAPVRSFSLRF
jgi:hypothetical protein